MGNDMKYRITYDPYGKTSQFPFFRHSNGKYEFPWAVYCGMNRINAFRTLPDAVKAVYHKRER